MASLKTLLARILNVKDTKVIGAEVQTNDDDLVELHIDVQPYKRHQWRCPCCDKACPCYDYRERPQTWRAPDWGGGILVYLHASIPRVFCPVHGVLTASVPWAYAGSRLTKHFDLMTAHLARETSKKFVSGILRIDWKTVGRSIERTLNDLEPDRKSRLNDLVNIGVDETSYTKGHNYITVVVNHDNGEVVWCHKGHGLSIFEKFFEELTLTQRASIKTVSGDGARWIDACIAKYVPHAARCVDPFHVVQWANDTVDELRRQRWRAARKIVAELEKEIKKKGLSDDEKKKLKEKLDAQTEVAQAVRAALYPLGKGEENLTENQRINLELILQNDSVLRRAHTYKEQLRLILKGANADDTGKAIDKWYRSAVHCRVPEVRELAKKIKRHKENIVRTIRHGLSNARVEATNNKIKLVIRKAYGFRDIENLLAMVYLVCSKLEIPLPNRKPKKDPEKESEEKQAVATAS